MEFQVQFPSLFGIVVHRSNGLISVYQLIIVDYPLIIADAHPVFARGDLFPHFSGERRGFDCITDGVAVQLAAGVEPLFFPRGVDILEEGVVDRADRYLGGRLRHGTFILHRYQGFLRKYR